MLDVLGTLRRNAPAHDGPRMFSDATASLTRAGVSARVAASAKAFAAYPDKLGLVAENGIDYAIAQLAAWTAGKTVVPLPLFFSAEQLGHIVRDADLTHAVVTPATSGFAMKLGLTGVPIPLSRSEEFPEPSQSPAQIIYTSGSTGRPKGVRLALAQIDKSARMLAAATKANNQDLFLSILPLPLLLETISAICVPLIAGAHTYFDASTAAAVASGRADAIAETFAKHRPTSSVLVPELLSAWVGDLQSKGERAPSSLRFIAVGGAPVSPATASKAWSAGIPAHEGYGLSECCSVVSLNRPGARKVGTVGKPLDGLDVRIEDREIVVRGPTVMQGYLNGADVSGEWRTGDIGTLDEEGYLTIRGRKDNVLVTSFGRNVSPEWIESLLLSDCRFGACGVVGHGEPYLSVVVVPTLHGTTWLSTASREQVLEAIAELCRDAPHYAVPKDFVVISKEDALMRGLFTSNGRIKRAALHSIFQDSKSEKIENPSSNIEKQEMTA